ncbi:UDP-N-acetylmuramoyl-tripeptide--D-alanyl-D-alanine ligase [Commensalibacter oyaizuii]|uniref:UDP-N-acetylmuramoyl-tripeptide--D-alanyl-D-alanine ligase n=1 Tax=Commensalibacter oyaizuii TaxID=3043873 RepID=A0ABT6Q0W6_9PROT|nr:UDP-N-acetylmuramoyl-tripeptide--D-alanyl-D-alanine ligase [Commensalibacter sp. TBRC 16381]MDI2090757.1 UDP-N-acetylmuramoyl-tripeptide--D-alanyl-D-alanine ligase [Commensalibacter sp. TBRC 16381]
MSVLWTKDDLVKATGGTFSIPFTSVGKGISIDTRTLQKDDIFIAITGDKNDGHDYVSKALQAGAACAIVSKKITDLESNAPLLYVDDTFKALTDMGRYGRSRFRGKTIAVTGSVGKTTTKEMLKSTLATFGTVHAAAGSHNNHLGVPLTLARLPEHYDFCVCEIGMNHSGEIAPLAALAKPDIAIVTEVASSHLGFMKSLEAIAIEKSQIITALSPNNTVLLPEHIYGLQIFKETAQQYQAHLQTIGTSSTADIQIDCIDLRANQSKFVLRINHHTISFLLSSPGEHLVRNAALVVGAANALNLELHNVSAALATFKTGKGRGQILPLFPQKGIVLDETYNASTLSVKTALKTLNLLAPKRKIAILGDILELAEHSKQEHLSLLPDLLENTDLVFGCGAMMNIVFEQLPQSMKGHWCASAQELIPFIKPILQDNDTLLIKGSNSMRMNIIVTALTAPAIRKN